MVSATLFSRTGGMLTALVMLFSNVTTAQDHCADVQVVSVNYGAFGDTAFYITVENVSQEFLLGYPQFHLVTATGDTIARQPLNLFALSPGRSTHRMELVPGEELPGALFTGTVLFFYFDGDGEHVCHFPVTANLCPPSCTPMNVFVYAEFGSHTTSTFPWSLQDSTGTLVASGELDLDLAGWQQDIDSLCLEPGRYTLSISQPDPSGLAFRFGASQDDLFFDGPNEALVAGGTGEVTFDFMQPCASAPRSVYEAEADQLQLATTGTRYTLTNQRGTALGNVAVHDAMGRMVQTFTAPSSAATLDLSNTPAGVYLITVRNGSATTLRVVVP